MCAPSPTAYAPALLLFEFRPQPAEAFRAGAGHPAEARTKEGVFLFTLELEAADFLIEMPEFLRKSHSLGKSFGERRALASGDTGAVETGDGVPADVALLV